MSDVVNRWIPIRSHDLTVEVDPHGAQLSTLKDSSGLDLLWNGDASIWAGRAPLLFPVVGALQGGRYRLGSKTYPLARHGFARGSEFQVVDASENRVHLRLKTNDVSLAVYPFMFELDVEFELQGATLSVAMSVRNTGAENLPASFGYHPAFRWPLPFDQPRSAHYIEFENEEPAPARRLDANGLLTAERHPSPIVHRRLVLEDELFAKDVIIFDEIRSKAVSYGAAGGPRLRVSFEGAPYLGLWTKPGAQFICIEPWHGIADPAGFSGDFSAKPGVFTVQPGSSRTISMHITLLTEHD